MYLSNKASMVSRSHRNALGDLDPPPELLEEVAELVKRIEACLRETPFDDLVDRLTNRDDDLGFPAGGGVPINVIPGTHKLACTALTLALAKGISPGSRLGFTNVMRTVRAYLIDCERIAKAVVLLTDTWSPRHTEEHLEDVYAHARQGRYVVPHIVTGDRILRVQWPLQTRVGR